MERNSIRDLRRSQRRQSGMTRCCVAEMMAICVDMYGIGEKELILLLSCLVLWFIRFPISTILIGLLKVPLLTRFSRANRVEPDSIAATNVEGKREHGSGRSSGPQLSGTTYCISSCSMILLNKIVLSGYACDAGISLMLYQNLISCVLVALLSLFGAVTLEKLNWKLIRLWLPINIIFVAMLVSGMYILKFINIKMVTILKNVTNILTAIGELYIFQKRQNQQVWTAMFLMALKSLNFCTGPDIHTEECIPIT
ncbi:hypothetical protein OROMI_031988 [Orobanche minor]